MQYIDSITNVIAVKFSFPVGGGKVLISAAGIVNTSGWSGEVISPRVYIIPPKDGIWDFDFLADPPSGQVLQVQLPVAANGVFAAPDWLKGVRVHAAGSNNYVETTTFGSSSLGKSTLPIEVNSILNATTASAAATSRVVIRDKIAAFDDSFNITGSCGGFSLKMKKLRHELFLVVEGPDERKIRRCIEEALGIGLIAAIIAVYATGGGALSAAMSALVAHVTKCLGNEFSVRLEDKSHWIHWCT